MEKERGYQWKMISTSYKICYDAQKFLPGLPEESSLCKVKISAKNKESIESVQRQDENING